MPVGHPNRHNFSAVSLPAPCRTALTGLRRLGLQPRRVTGVHIGLPHPLAVCPGRDPQPRSDRFIAVHGESSSRHVVPEQANGLYPQLSVVPAWHRAIVPDLGCANPGWCYDDEVAVRIGPGSPSRGNGRSAGCASRTFSSSPERLDVVAIQLVPVSEYAEKLHWPQRATSPAYQHV